MRWAESWTVEVRVAAVDPAGEPQSCTLTVEISDGLLALLSAGSAGQDVVDACLAAIRDWSDVIGPDGEPVPWSDERRRQIARWPWLLAPTIRAIADAALEVRKNS